LQLKVPHLLLRQSQLVAQLPPQQLQVEAQQRLLQLQVVAKVWMPRQSHPRYYLKVDPVH
jgi:hypothetical protein